MTLKAITAITMASTMTNASHAGEWTWPGEHRSHRDSRAAGLWLLAPGKARARQSDAGVALAAGGDSDVGTAPAHGHTNTGPERLRCKPGSNLTRR
jgi:hypothetical protein